MGRSTSDRTVLDYGAGRGLLPHLNIRDRVAFVAGVDIDPIVMENSHLHEARVPPVPRGRIPYPDAHFDVVFFANVLEHVDDPVSTFREIARVLAPGGRFILRTNRWHYVPVIALLTPYWFQVWVNIRRWRKSHDTFQTHYRCNTMTSIRRVAVQSGFVVQQIEQWEGRPEYLRFNTLTYGVGLVWERLVNRWSVLAPLRCVLVATLQKTDAPNPGRAR